MPFKHVKKEQDDALLSESRLRRKQQRRIRNQAERFGFEQQLNSNPNDSKKTLEVTFSVWYGLNFMTSPKRVKSLTLFFNKYVDRKQVEEKIKNALESV